MSNLCWGAGWVCWGAWSHDKQETALPLVAGLHRCGQKTGWWTSRGPLSGWAPGTSCSTLLVSYFLSILRNIKHTFMDKELLSELMTASAYTEVPLWQWNVWNCANQLSKEYKFSKWETNLKTWHKTFLAIYIHYVSNLQWVIFKKHPTLQS